MTRRLLLSYVTITIVVLAVLEVPLGLVFARSERRTLVSELKQDALSLGTIIEETLEGAGSTNIDRVVRDYRDETGGRVVVTDAKGILIADSSADEVTRRDFSSRPEIAAAMDGRIVDGERHSDTLGSDLVYVAVPVASGGDVYGTIRITFTPTQVDALIRRGWFVLALVGLGVLVTTTSISVVLARSVSKPLRRLERAATDLAGGALDARVVVESGPHEVRALADAFNVMAARLQQLIDAQQDFVADASHQLRSPLHALRLRLENAQALASPDAREDLDAAIDETTRLGDLVDGLLQLARSEAAPTATRAIDVAAIVRSRIDSWETFADQQGVRLTSVVPPDASAALATPGHLEQILDNFISNAIKAAPDGSAVTLRATRDDGVVEVHVADRGPGMDADQRDRATTRFWSASSTADGTGIGLAIAQRLATLDGGAIELRDHDGGGLDAVVRLRAA